MAEGYVVSRQGSGTYVAEGIAAAADQPPLAERAPALSAWGQRLMSRSGEYVSAQLLLKEPPGYDLFRECEDAHGGFSLFGVAERVILCRRKRGAELQNGAPPEGDIELRRAIAGHLRFTRGIQADPEHIVVFSGSMQDLS